MGRSLCLYVCMCVCVFRSSARMNTAGACTQSMPGAVESGRVSQTGLILTTAAPQRRDSNWFGAGRGRAVGGWGAVIEIEYIHIGKALHIKLEVTEMAIRNGMISHIPIPAKPSTVNRKL